MSRQRSTRWLKLKEHFFFGNYFYGLCAVALSVEAMLQQQCHLNDCWYFVTTFLATVLFYSYPYVRKCRYVTNNSRTNWYTSHYTLMRWSQSVILISLLILFHLFLLKYWKILLHLPVRYWVLLSVFPLTAFLYYGTGIFPTKYNLRKIGLFKPFIIGFAWAGVVTIYPVLFHNIINNEQFDPGWVGSLLFLKNFLFIALLCIMFDVKDYAADYIAKVNTFVVRVGLRKTIFYILFPIAFSGLCVFIYYAIDRHFHTGKLLLNIIPFVLLMAIGFSLRRRRQLMYYLSIVDGLMIVKALCGSIAMLYF